jgi:hypothetical protein
MQTSESPLGMESSKHSVRLKASKLHIRKNTYMMMVRRMENVTNSRTSTKQRFSLQNGFDRYLNKAHKQQADHNKSCCSRIYCLWTVIDSQWL